MKLRMRDAEYIPADAHMNWWWVRNGSCQCYLLVSYLTLSSAHNGLLRYSML